MPRLNKVVVDDEESTREVLKRALEIRGCQTTVAPSVAEAGELLERQAFHLMILDNRMPGKSGIVLERRAKALEIQQYQKQLERLVAQRTDDIEQRNHDIFTLNAQFQKSLNKGISIQQAYQEAQETSPFGSFKI